MPGDPTPGFDIVCDKLKALGTEAFDQHGCNVLAIIIDKKSNDGKSHTGKGYESPGATGFFSARIQGGEENLINHLKCFLPRHVEPPSAANRSEDDVPTTNKRKRVQVPDLPNDEDVPPLKRKNRDPDHQYYFSVKQAIIKAAAHAGLDFGSKSVPWKKLSKICIDNGVYLNNYPHNVRSPFHEVSLRNMTVPEHKALLRALTEEETHPMQFVKAAADPSAEHGPPILVYAPPPPGSTRRRSKRYFSDGQHDYKGYWRLEPGGEGTTGSRPVADMDPRDVACPMHDKQRDAELNAPRDSERRRKCRKKEGTSLRREQSDAEVASRETACPRHNKQRDPKPAAPRDLEHHHTSWKLRRSERRTLVPIRRTRFMGDDDFNILSSRLNECQERLDMHLAVLKELSLSQPRTSCSLRGA